VRPADHAVVGAVQYGRCLAADGGAGGAQPHPCRCLSSLFDRPAVLDPHPQLAGRRVRTTGPEQGGSAVFRSASWCYRPVGWVDRGRARAVAARPPWPAGSSATRPEPAGRVSDRLGRDSRDEPCTTACRAWPRRRVPSTLS